MCVNLKNVLMWVCLFLFGCCVLIWLVGCAFDSPEARYANHVQVFSVGGCGVDRATLNDEGEVQHAEADLVVGIYTVDGTQITVGGIIFEQVGDWIPAYYNDHCWYDSELAGVNSGLTSDASGYCKITTWCEKWKGVDWYLSAGFGIKGRHTEPGYGTCHYSNGMNPLKPMQLIPFYGTVVYNNYIYYGGNYTSASMPDNAISEDDVTPAASTSSNNLSTDDDNFLVDEKLTVSNGIDLYRSSWCIRSGPVGQGYSKTVGQIFPLGHSDPTRIAMYATPYFFSQQVVLSEAISEDDETVEIPATIKVGNFQTPITCHIVSVSEDRKRIIVQSDYIVPIEKEDYTFEDPRQSIYNRWEPTNDANDLDIYAPLVISDPNSLIDPNFISDIGIRIDNLNHDLFIDVYVVPILEGEKIQIRFDKDSATLLQLVGYWLSDNKNIDINDDGIVNWSDIL